MDMKDETKSQTKTNLNVKGASPTEETSGQEAQETVVQNPLQEMKELLQRTQANFENYRKQMEKQIIEARKMAAAEIILQILPVVDNFELALKSADHTDADQNANKGEFIQGVELIYSQLMGVLQQNDVEPMDTEGKIFDPYFHEALLKVNSSLPENRIIEEFQKGFTLHGKVIRHAKVKLSAGPENKTNSQNKNNQENKNYGGK